MSAASATACLHPLIVAPSQPVLMLTIVPIWFMASIVVEVFGNAAFVSWLRRQGAEVRFAWVGIPFYVDRVYAEWCRAHEREPGKILLLRKISLVNVAVAAFFTILLLGR